MASKKPDHAHVIHDDEETSTVPIMTQAKLMGVQCSDPDCTSDHRNNGIPSPLRITSACHGMAVHATYWNGYLKIECAECEGLLMLFEIATGDLETVH